MSLGLPSIDIVFQNTASTAIQRGERGTVVLLLKDTVPATNPIVMTSTAEIPTSLTADNIAQINLAWLGYQNPPKKVIAYIIASATTDYTVAETALETMKWDYIAFPAIETAETAAFVTWIKACRDSKNLKVKAILPNTVADYEGVINFATDDIIVGTTTYTATEYCSRIAGILAGTPLTMSATFAPLTEVDDVPHHTKAELDALIAAGKFVLFNDGEKVKVARAVNSLTTTTTAKGEDFQKIKIVDILDQIYSDITTTANDNYIGKYSNNYDNKCILVAAINTYLTSMAKSGILDIDETNSVSIDTDANQAYLESKETGSTADMTTQELKEANTGSYVYLTGNITPTDAMEDITLNFYL